jgi:hypothetical protein
MQWEAYNKRTSEGRRKQKGMGAIRTPDFRIFGDEQLQSRTLPTELPPRLMMENKGK